MSRNKIYAGINNEANGGMTATGKMIRDAWVFGLLEESQTCEGWLYSGIEALQDKVNKEWDKYGCMVSELPVELLEKHRRIHAQAIQEARAAGWSGEAELGDDK